MQSTPQTNVELDLESDDFNLDDLLSESLELHEAKQANRKGKKLTEAQKEILEANAAALHFEQWQGYMLIAHVELTTCACGCAWEGFAGWYEYQVNRRDSTKQMLSRKSPGEKLPPLPRQQYRTILEVEACSECLPAMELPVADLDQLPMLLEFGNPAEWDTEYELEIE